MKFTVVKLAHVRSRDFPRGLPVRAGCAPLVMVEQGQ